MAQKVVYVPTINLGWLAGDSPACWDDKPFNTKEECEAWIEEHRDEFTEEECGGSVYAQDIFC